MELPLLLPEVLTTYSFVGNDTELFQALEVSPRELLIMVEYGSRDGMWAGQHISFFRLALAYLTARFFDDHLDDSLAYYCYRLVHEIPDFLEPLLPKDITVVIENVTIDANSLLFAMSSHYLYDLLRSQPGSRRITLDQGSSDTLGDVIEYIQGGRIQQLWKHGDDEVLVLLRDADALMIDDLVVYCSESLKRYINMTNVVRYLLMAHKRRWVGLRSACCRFVEERSVGITFPPCDEESFAIHFHQFSEEGLDFFTAFCAIVTHLAFDDPLHEASLFSQCVQSAPSLIAVDLSGSRTFSDRLNDLPQTLEALNLSMCSWLDDKTLSFFTRQCPDLIALDLSSNGQLNYKCWGVLAHFECLSSLSIARCYRVSDDDLALIGLGCSRLVALDLEECTALTDQGLERLQLKMIERLNLSRCTFIDAGIIHLVDRLPALHTLTLRRCPNVGDRTLREVVKLGRQLRLVDVAQTEVSDRLVAELRRSNPHVDIVIDSLADD